MHLVSFDPTKVLPFLVDGGTKTERELFDAFWIVYRTGDATCPAESVRQAIKIRDMIEAKTAPGGSIKLAGCGACGQRLARHDELRTLPDGDAVLYLRFEDKDHKYVQDCFAKWQSVTGELRRYFGHLQDMFEDSKSKTADEIDDVIRKQVTILSSEVVEK